MSRIRNFSRKDDYHTQRDNALIPHASCNATSMVMALKQAGWEPPEARGMQPEDYLTHFLQSEEGYAAMRRLAPWAFDNTTNEPLYPPNQVHAVLSWGVNELLGREISRFSTDRPFEGLIDALHKGCGVVLSGVFPTASGGELRHVVSLAGYILKSEYESLPESKPATRDQISEMIIDDPYGDYISGYQNHHGADIRMPMDDFVSLIRQPGYVKWAHIVSPRG